MAPKLAPARVIATPLPHGGMVLRSPQELAPYARCLAVFVEDWARATPEADFLVERDPAGRWRSTSYGETLAAMRAIGQGLCDLGVTATRPVMLLSENSVDHALLQLGAMYVGLPVAPISPAYSLVSQDLKKLRAIAAELDPSLIYAADGASYARALDAVARPGTRVILSDRVGDRSGAVGFAELRAARPTNLVAARAAAVGPETIGKILFTSGSTGAPKGVVNTQRMMCSNQQAIAQLWPFLDERPPVIVDWLPFSHTFGGNHNFNMVLRAGGTLYIDRGKPAPGSIELTVANLRDISPTLYFNVPRGFDVLLPFLEEDAALRDTFFARLELIFYAAAALPQSSWRRLEEVARRARGTVPLMVSAWGSTETAPLATGVHFPISRAGVIGLPPPGSALKLAPTATKLEMRALGPNVTPGYWILGGAIRPLALDEDGYLPTGDAGRLEDPADPSRGVVFDGRIAENFKLTSGTWVSVGELRVMVVAAAVGLVQDAVVCGHDRDALGLLLFVTAAARTGDGRDRLAAALVAHNRACPASSTRIARALVVDEPPSIDGGEITDKGYLNQQALLARRAAEVARLFADPPDAAVLVLG